MHGRNFTENAHITGNLFLYRRRAEIIYRQHYLYRKQQAQVRLLLHEIRNDPLSDIQQTGRRRAGAERLRLSAHSQKLSGKYEAHSENK